MTDVKQDFENYWPEFLDRVKEPVLRNTHLIATALAFYLLFRFLVDLEIFSLVAAPVLQIGIVLAAHNIVENKKPPQFDKPLLATFAEFRMLAMWCAGVLESQMQGAKNGKETTKDVAKSQTTKKAQPNKTGKKSGSKGTKKNTSKTGKDENSKKKAD